ncbi:MAG: hypothetical protein M1825_001242 [Sarcosagium campestre]|nr:MAG: hypothetical protein M1825_001242 [Sarcosagium campestre]
MSHHDPRTYIFHQNSNSFFKAAKSLVTITQVLDASCNAGFASCSALMASYAQSLKQDSNCGEDFNNQNPLVVQALNGLVSYDPMYQAGCLRSDSGSYCFADAITNVDNPPDSYIYFLPLGLSLPGNSRPTCNSCLQKSMAIFATAAGNASQPASTVYISTAHQIQVGCGPTFVNSTVQTVDSAGGAATLATNGLTTVAFIAFLVALSAWLL